MDNRHDDISASDLLAKLKANMAEEETAPVAETAASAATANVGKKYHFRRAPKSAEALSDEAIAKEMPLSEEELFVSPVPKSDIEDLDIDALMKKYLPEEDYAKMTARDGEVIEEAEDELVRTLTSIELVREEESRDGETAVDSYEEANAEYTAPDSELFAHLSRGGKVCDVPGEGEEDQKSDTRPAPLRPMTEEERTIAFGTVSDEEDAAFGSVRELMQAEKLSRSEIVAEDAPVSFDTAEIDPVDDAPTVDLTALLKAIGEELPAEEEAEESAPEAEASDGVESAEVEAENEILTLWEMEEVEETVPAETAETVEQTDIPYETEAEETPAEGFAMDDFMAIASMGEDTTVFDLSSAEQTEEPAVEEEPREVAVSETVADDILAEETVAFRPVEESEDAELDAADMAIVPADEVAFEDAEGFDETDANLMLAFGMDEELDSAIGKERADKLRSDMGESIPVEEKPVVKKEKPKEPVREYISPAETKTVLDGYKKAYGRSALRLFGVIAVTIVLFFYENLTTFGGHLADALNPEFFPVVNIMVGLQILLIGFALCFKNLVRGYRGLIENEPTPDSFLPVMLVVSVLYSTCACFFPAGTTFVSFHFPMSLGLLLTVLNERLDLRREIMSFNIVSSKRNKFALEKLDIDDAELETRAFDEFLPKSPSIFKINKTSFVDGYFRRTKAYPGLKQVLSAFLPATLVALVVGMMVGAFRFRAWDSSVMLGYTVFSFSMPLSIFLTFGLPAFKAAKIAYGMNSAFVGESAVDEYTTAASISFDDREVFPTGGVKLRSVKVFGSGRIDTVIYNLASVYAILGGPLSDVLNVATADLGRSENVEILVIENEGVEAIVDEHHLYVGKAGYLLKHGFVPVSDPDDEEIEGGGDTGISYLVCDDEVVAKVYVRYRIDPEFEVTLKNLYRSGICVGIKTVDPNINDEMLSTRIRLSKYPVRVLKYSDVSGSRRGSERTDSGIVSKKSAKALLRTFTLCDNVKHVTRTNLVVNAITMIVGIVISLAVAVLGTISGIASVYVALFQFFWLIPVYLISRFMLM